MDPELIRLLRTAKPYDLGQPYFPGMPHWPSHPPFLYGLTKKHGEQVLDGGFSSAAESISLGTHVGTHIDALCHVSRGGLLHGGLAAEGRQSYQNGIELLSIDTVAPIFRRGVLLDIAGLAGCDALPEDFTVTVEHLEEACHKERVTVEQGDVVLVRTGWAAFWNDPIRYINGVRAPGPEPPGARWLSQKGIFAAGSDTVAFERVPSPGMGVHVHLLVESGIHIIEALNLEELARGRVYEFAFAALPLKIRGGTGSPVRPVALVI
jgi:kynurenine formamidase